MTLDKKYDCLCAGIVVADYLCAPIERMPRAGELAMTTQHSLAIGGCASNVATDLCKLGLRVAVAGRVGNDVLGNFVRTSLVYAGVQTTHLLETTEFQTSGTQVINVRGEDRRFIHSMGANAAFDGADITAELIRSAKVLYVGGFLLMPRLRGKEVASLFRMAREAGVPTVLDVVIPEPRNWWPELEEALPFTDVFLPNSDEGQLLTGLSDPLEQARQFQSAGAKTVVITCGGEGAVLVNADQTLHAGKFPVTFVDGTGSGDAFDAGYISGLLEGHPPARCLEIGSALGASCVRLAGATTGVFTRAELDAFLAKERLEITAG